MIMAQPQKLIQSLAKRQIVWGIMQGIMYNYIGWRILLERVWFANPWCRQIQCFWIWLGSFCLLPYVWPKYPGIYNFCMELVSFLQVLIYRMVGELDRLPKHPPRKILFDLSLPYGHIVIHGPISKLACSIKEQAEKRKRSWLRDDYWRELNSSNYLQTWFTLTGHEGPSSGQAILQIQLVWYIRSYTFTYVITM